MVSLLLLLGNCNAATAWAHRGEWLEAAFGRHRRWGPPPLLEGSLRQSSQSCTIQLPAWVEDKNLGSKMLPQESPANRRERCGDHMLAKPYFRHSRSCLSSRRGYIKGWSSTICTQFGDGPSPITHWSEQVVASERCAQPRQRGSCGRRPEEEQPSSARSVPCHGSAPSSNSKNRAHLPHTSWAKRSAPQNSRRMAGCDCHVCSSRQPKL